MDDWMEYLHLQTRPNCYADGLEKKPAMRRRMFDESGRGSEVSREDEQTMDPTA